MSNSNSADKWQKFAEQNQNNSNNPSEKDQLEGESENPAESQLEFPTRQKLEDQLTYLEKQVEDCKQQTARAQAELENFRRRSERDLDKAYKYSVEPLIHSLLPVVDSLVRGLQSAVSNDPKVKVIHEGMQLTLDLLEKALTKFGVKVIDPAIGDPFDPKLHEAMGMQQIPGAAPNTIAQVLQKGYQLHERVLRAAMVMVAT
jgi:molecular chaperone GrpE